MKLIDQTDDTTSYFPFATQVPGPSISPTNPQDQIVSPGGNLTSNIAYISAAAPGDPIISTLDFNDGTGPRTVSASGGAVAATSITAPTGPAINVTSKGM